MNSTNATSQREPGDESEFETFAGNGDGDISFDFGANATAEVETPVSMRMEEEEVSSRLEEEVSFQNDNVPTSGQPDDDAEFFGEVDPDVIDAWNQEQEAAKKPRRKKSSPDDGAAPPLIRRLEDAICAKEKFAKTPDDNLYVFRNGVYIPQGKRVVAAAVKSLLRQWNQEIDWGTKLATETQAFITIDAPELWESPPLDRINLENGILDVGQRKLLPHDPGFLSPVQLPIKFDRDAVCHNIDKFIGEVFPADAVQLGYEIAAWLMLPMTDVQKAILFHGPGGDGKSTFLSLMQRFLGRGNVSGVSLHRLEADRFSAVRLLGKLANICADLPAEHLAGTSVFKAITGGDALVGERKFHGSFEFYPYARLLFSANSLPRSADSSKGFFDRWIVVPFCGSFRGTAAEIPRAELDARLSAPSELSGLLNKALAVLPEFRSRNGFSQAASVQEAAKDFRSLTDPMAVWLDRFTVDAVDAVTPCDTLRFAYNAEQERRGRPQVSKTEFGTALSMHRPNVERKQRTVGMRKNVWCYTGIELSPVNDSRQTPVSPSEGFYE